MQIKKKSGLFTAILAVVLSVNLSANAQDKVVPATELPAAAHTFIKQHFKDQTIDVVRKDKGLISTDYDVRLSNGIELEFDDKGNWEEVDGNHIAIPASVIPKTIATYAATHYKGQAIVKIDKKRSGDYKIELANDVELVFDKNGKFLRIDD
ncbi:hypothetical protein D3C87_735590 [compost metagenome]